MAMITRLKVNEEYADIELGDLGYLYIVCLLYTSDAADE